MVRGKIAKDENEDLNITKAKHSPLTSNVIQVLAGRLKKAKFKVSIGFTS